MVATVPNPAQVAALTGGGPRPTPPADAGTRLAPPRRRTLFGSYIPNTGTDRSTMESMRRTSAPLPRDIPGILDGDHTTYDPAPRPATRTPPTHPATHIRMRWITTLDPAWILVSLHNSRGDLDGDGWPTLAANPEQAHTETEQWLATLGLRATKRGWVRTHNDLWEASLTAKPRP